MKFLGTEKKKPEPITRDSVRKAFALTDQRGPASKNIAVFCAGGTPDDPLFTKHARELGKLIGLRGHNLVWGATHHGNMKHISNAARAKGALLLGVGFAQEEPTMTNADILLGAKTLEERKDTMMRLGDAVIALAGGIGTFDEIVTVVEGSARLCPVVLLNTHNYYAGMHEQLARMYEDGFMPYRPDELVQLVDTPLAAIEAAESIARGERGPALSFQDAMVQSFMRGGEDIEF